MSFKDWVIRDNVYGFLNGREFAERHNLNGCECMAVVQSVTATEELSTGRGQMNYYPGLYGARLQIDCLVGDLQEKPVYGQTFTVDGDLYLVESCSEAMGMLTILLVSNER